MLYKWGLILIFILFCYFFIIGSLPFALIVHNLLSTNDPRELGSKILVRQICIELWTLAGVLTFTGDFSKRFYTYIYVVDFEPTILYLAAFFILAGHMFSFSIGSAEAKVLPPLLASF